MNSFLQQVLCYEIFVLDYMFLYLPYSAHDCYYTGLERIGRHQRLLQVQPGITLERYFNDLHEALLRKRGDQFWKCWNSQV